MNDKELRALVERMVADLMGQAPTPQVKGADYHPMEPQGDSAPEQSGAEALEDTAGDTELRFISFTDEENGQTEIRRVKKMDKSVKVYLRSHLIAAEEADKLSWAASPRQLQLKNARKIKVDVLGRVFDPKSSK